MSTIAQIETGSGCAQHRSEFNPTRAGEEDLEEIPQPPVDTVAETGEGDT